MKADLHDKIMRLPCAVPFPIVNDSKLAYMEGHRDARHAAAELALAESGGNAAPGLTEKKIDAIWDALPGLSVISGQPQDQWNRLLRHEFARAIEAASAPNAALVAALQGLLNCDKNGSFGARVEAVNRAVAALSAAGQEVGHG